MLLYHHHEQATIYNCQNGRQNKFSMNRNETPFHGKSNERTFRLYSFMVCICLSIWSGDMKERRDTIFTIDFTHSRHETYMCCTLSLLM